MEWTSHEAETGAGRLGDSAYFDHPNGGEPVDGGTGRTGDDGQSVSGFERHAGAHRDYRESLKRRFAGPVPQRSSRQVQGRGSGDLRGRYRDRDRGPIRGDRRIADGRKGGHAGRDDVLAGVAREPTAATAAGGPFEIG